jgi:hypothetical protein
LGGIIRRKSRNVVAELSEKLFRMVGLKFRYLVDNGNFNKQNQSTTTINLRNAPWEINRLRRSSQVEKTPPKSRNKCDASQGT